MVLLKFRGLMAPAFLALKKNLSLNLELIFKYSKYLVGNGVQGVLVHGTSGEGPSLSVAERKAVLEEWIKAATETKQHIMVQVGGCPLPDVLDLANHAEQSGADSILCLPEIYFRPANSKDLISYLKLIGAAAPNTPLLYYHNPLKSGVNNINMGQFIPEAAKNIPSFQGIKYTSNDLDGGLAAVRAGGGKHAVFIGAHNLFASSYLMGLDSSIAGVLNTFPKLVIDLVTAAESKNFEEARTLQDRLTTYANAILQHGDPVATMKVAMSLLTPIDVGVARPPNVNLSEDKLSDMKQSLKALSLL